MLKKSRLFGIIVLLMSVCAMGTAFGQIKVGYINSQRVLAILPSAIEARGTLEKESNAWRDELQKMETEFQDRQEQLQQQSMLLSEEKKQEKAGELQALLVRAQQFQNEKWGDGGEFFRRQAELLQPVYDQIKEAIKQVRTSEGYDFILDAVNILDADQKYDLTDKLLKALGVEVPASGK